MTQEPTAPETPQIQWHRLLGRLLEELLTPVGITVLTGVPIMSNPPEADVLLLRRGEEIRWTDEQFARLPDGVRHSHAGHILLEFKYTESVNLSALEQAIGYDHFYRRSHQLSTTAVQTFLLSSRQPNGRFLKIFDYQPSEWAGVYYSHNPMLTRLPIISLNRLSNAEHNAFVKCFASQQQEKMQAFAALQGERFLTYDPGVYWLLLTLWQYWFKSPKGEDEMKTTLSPDDLIAIGEAWADSLLSILPREKLLSHLTIEERLAGLQAAERLAGLQPAERLAGLQPAERLAGLQPAERLAGLQPAERLAGLTEADIAKIEAYLLQYKQQKKTADN